MKQFQIPRTVKWVLTTGLLFLILLTLMRILLFLFFNRQSHVLKDLVSSFVLGLRFELRMVCVLMLFMLVLGSIRLFSPFRSRAARGGWNILFGILVIGVILFYFVDFAHYAYLSQRLNASVLNYLGDAGISLTMVWQSYPVIKLIIALLVASFIVLWGRRFLFRKVEKSRPVEWKGIRTVWFVLLFLLFGLGIFGRVNQYPLRWSDAFQLGDDYKAQLALNPFESFINTLKYRHSVYDIKEVKAAYQVLAPYYNLSPQNTAPDFKRFVRPKDSLSSQPNVVLVICESFSAYKCSVFGNPLNTTPYFDQMCRQGIFFDRCFTPTYGTARGVWAVLTGIPDVEIANTASRNPAAVDQHCIINDYHGYEKFYFIGGSASWANIRGLLTNNIAGLHLFEEEDFKATRVDVWGVSDKNLLLEANKVLAKQAKPFFAVIQTADNHRPYTIPAEDANEFKKLNYPKDSIIKYGFESNEEVNAFRYSDFCFQKFMETASRENYFSNTIFIFIGDHGIPGNASALFPPAWTEKRLTSEHVPLLFYAPKLLQPARVSRPASQIDVLPIAAGLCKIPYLNSALGRDLLDSAYADKAFAFIFDPDNRMVGTVNDSFFYRKSFSSSNEEIVSVKTDMKNATALTKEQLRQLTEAMFETSKYLLLNNKKN